MNVVICFSPNWARHVLVQMYSLFKNNNRKINLYLVTDSIGPGFSEDVKGIAAAFGNSVKIIDLSAFLRKNMNSKKNVDSRFTKYTLFRLAIPNIIDVDRILYLDADTLVVGDISEFYDMDLGADLIAGCRDTGIAETHVERYAEGNPNYINAGVILFDLKRIVEEGLHSNWISLCNSHHFPCHDQDIINKTLNGRVKLVSNNYNISASTSYDVDEPKIYHFAGAKGRSWVKGQVNDFVWDKVQEDYDKFCRFGVPGPQKIPKVIAYGWFGGGKFPDKIKYCVDSWSKFDYEVVQLNEENCDVNAHHFTREAYAAKKYAFVADYFRMKYMYENGGITLDADVELLKPLDEFLHHGFFSGQEVEDKVLITATMGSEKGNPIVKMILDYYDTVHFNPHKMVPNTQFITKIFNLFIEGKSNGKILLSGDGHLYPREYFCNFDHKRLKVIPSPNSYAIHWFEGSWLDVPHKR